MYLVCLPHFTISTCNITFFQNELNFFSSEFTTLLPVREMYEMERNFTALEQRKLPTENEMKKIVHIQA